MKCKRLDWDGGGCIGLKEIFFFKEIIYKKPYSMILKNSYLENKYSIIVRFSFNYFKSKKMDLIPTLID